MNSYERVMNRLKGKAVDRAPNFCILMNFTAQYSNVCYRDFCLVPEKMVEANLRCREDFATDIVTVMSDPVSYTHLDVYKRQAQQRQHYHQRQVDHDKFVFQ